MLSAKLCVKCKGKLLCGLKSCPILDKFNLQKKVVSSITNKEFSGSSPPSVFVSWHNYPKISIAPLSPPEISNTAFLDAPEHWFGLPAEQIISFREQLIRSSKPIEAASASNPSYDIVEIQELAMSQKPVAASYTLQKRPIPMLSFNQTVAPMGPSAPLQKMSFEENPSIPQKVDYLTADTDAKAATSMMELYQHDFPVSFLSKLLSAGTLGVKKARKFVPTRWSITAIDSNISKELVEEKVKQFKQISSFQLFHSNYLDNDFWVLLIPSSWAFEQLEAWQPGGIWTETVKVPQIIQDHEFYSGRRDYASNVEGAYYSSRLAVAEYLTRKRRQAACVVFREIGSDYRIPLGVWQIR